MTTVRMLSTTREGNQMSAPELLRLYKRHERQSLQYAQALYAQATAWTSFWLSHSAQPPGDLYTKAFDALAFCFLKKPAGFAVPSKLAGVSRTQKALQTLAQAGPSMGLPLEVRIAGNGRLKVFYDDQYLGYIHDKHDWLRPLLPHGASVYLLQVTGLDAPDKTLGLNVAIGFVAQAIMRLNQATSARRVAA